MAIANSQHLSEDRCLSIRKVVIPVAGFGTRLLPTTKALPKEMLPVGRIPVIQHVVEEMADAGLTKQLFVTSRQKTIIENQFDNNTALIRHLGESGRLSDLGDFDYRARGVEFFYSRQQAKPGATAPGGTGEAILAGESFVANEPFLVAYGDTIIHGTSTRSFSERLIAAHSASDCDVTIGVRPVPGDQISLYGIVKPDGNHTDGDSFLISDIVEKPDPDQAPSNLAVSARYVFNPSIFDSIRGNSDQDAEQGITGAIKSMMQNGSRVQCVALRDDETRYDIGNHESYYRAFIDFALNDPDCGDRIRSYIREKGSGS